jgi:RecA/RadA recombinase
MLELEIRINGYDLIVIDNLMSILSVSASEKYEQQADFMQRLHDLADNYNTHIILVLHPNKTYRKDDDEMDMEQISGTSDLYNKADNVIVVNRSYDEDDLDMGISGRIAVVKNRDFEDLPRVNTFFDKETGLLLEIEEDTNAVVGYTFNWDKDVVEGFQLVVPTDNPF